MNFKNPLMLFVFFTFKMSLIVNISFAQQVLEHKKGSFIDSLNRFYQQADLPVYLYISNTPDERPKPLKEERNNSVEPIFLDGPGVHHLRHSDALHNRADLFKIYADATPPVSSLGQSETTPHHSKSGKKYHGKGLRLKFTAKDDMSGVGGIFVSVNQAGYTEYKRELQFEKEGSYSITYYAVDNVGNIESPKTFKFTIDTTAPSSYYTVEGLMSGNSLASSSFFKLNVETDSSSVAKTYYAFDQDSPKLYNGKNISVANLTTGIHTLYYWSIDNVGNTENHKAYEFFLDNVAPIASIDILGDKFVVDNKIYLSGRTKIKITAVDNRTDIKELKYSINNDIFKDYTESFYMPNKVGMYTIQYFVSDNLNNRSTGEVLQSKGVIYVDLLGPELEYKFLGPVFKKKDEIFVGSKTKFSILAKDIESGIKSLAYRINGGEEKEYKEAFEIEESTGKYSIDYIGYDNVNNRNERNVSFSLDAEGPEISIRYSTESEVKTDMTTTALYPSYTLIYVAATDAKTTCSTIYYSVDGGKESLYISPLKDFRPNKKYKIRLRAKDALDNETIKEIEFHTADF